MSESEKFKSFWTTLPGLLAGLGTFITAIVGVFSFVSSNQANRQPTETNIKPSKTMTAAVRPGKPGKTDACQEIVGNWQWFMGAVNFTSDGFVGWRQNINDLRPQFSGTWACVDGPARRFAISWPNGFVDTLTLSSDGNSISGSNQVGTPISGVRAK